MPAWQRSYLAVCGFAAAFLLGYLGCDYYQWTRFVYAPAEARWSVSSRVGRLPIGLYGQLAWGLGAGLLAALLVGTGARLSRKPLRVQSLQLAAGWTMALAAIAVGYFAWHSWP